MRAVLAGMHFSAAPESICGGALWCTASLQFYAAVSPNSPSVNVAGVQESFGLCCTGGFGALHLLLVRLVPVHCSMQRAVGSLHIAALHTSTLQKGTLCCVCTTRRCCMHALLGRFHEQAGALQSCGTGGQHVCCMEAAGLLSLYMHCVGAARGQGIHLQQQQAMTQQGNAFFCCLL